MSDQEAKLNTDRELWREREGDYYADSIFVTTGGGIGIEVGGYAIVRPLRKWHEQDTTLTKLQNALDESVKLQSHYASLLNYYDGGQRMEFADTGTWLKRLDSLTDRVALKRPEGKV